jgi:hypothetical protein
MFRYGNPDQVYQAWLEKLTHAGVQQSAAALVLRSVHNQLTCWSKDISLASGWLALRIDDVLEALWDECSDPNVWNSMLCEEFGRHGPARELRDSLIRTVACCANPNESRDNMDGVPDSYGEHDGSFSSDEMQSWFEQLEEFRGRILAEETNMLTMFAERINNPTARWEEIGRPFGLSGYRASELVKEFAERLGHNLRQLQDGDANPRYDTEAPSWRKYDE